MFEFFKDRNKKKQFCYSYLIFLGNGMLALSIGSLLPYIRAERGLEYAFMGLLVSLHSIGNLFSSFTAGILPNILGRKKSILVFNACFAISYILMIHGNHKAILVIAFFMTGVARGATSNFCNLVINELSPGRVWMISCLHATFSVGAFTIPLLITALTTVSSSYWIYGCYFMVGIGLISWLLYYLMPVEETQNKKTKEKGSGFAFLKEPLFYLCTGTMFFYLCVEQGVIGWLITYFKDTGRLQDFLSQMMASVLWITILIGRLTTAWLSTKINKGKLLLIMGVGLVAFFFLLLGSKTPEMITVGVIGFGFSMSGIYPTTVSFTGKIIYKYPIAWSFILTLASIGAIVMPSIIGGIAEKIGIFYGMSSIVVVVIIDLIFIVALVTYIKKKESANSNA